MEAGQKQKEEFGEFDPLGASPMGGIEKFTIRRVGNPLLMEGEADGQLVRALFLGMHKGIAERIAKISGTRRSTIVFEPRSIARISPTGSVEMEVATAPRYKTVGRIGDMLVDEMFRSMGSDLDAVLEVFDLFWARMARQEFKADDLMSTLLVCIEERKPQKQKPQAGANYPRPQISAPHEEKAARGEIVSPYIPALQPVAQEVEIGEAEVDSKQFGEGNIGIKIVSIREMLREYFEKYPHRYHEAIEAVLGGRNIPPSQIEAAIESEIERIGVWEFATRVWMHVRKWSMKDALEGGIIAPIDNNEKWILCPKWEGRGAKYNVAALAHMISRHYAAAK
ncbi:MAG: hypothetical protein V1822_01120 [Candidatus Micrarchaeota archaeon]